MNHDPSSEPELRPHSYDGIQEYDQKLPNWWLFTLYITIVYFVIAWVLYYQVGVGQEDGAQVDALIQSLEKAREAELANVTDDKLWEMSLDAASVAAGKQTYLTTCSPCHAPDLTATLGGAKLPGLPLVDKEWKHGHTPVEVMTIIRKGAPDVTKGMIAWESALGTKRITEIVAFIMSHHKKGEAWTPAVDALEK
jgi:cytochrome c oxidase cbb3-type subunit 3